MRLSGVQGVLWLASFLGNVALCVVLVASRRYRRVPLFASLISFGMVRTVALFAVFRTGFALGYLYAYWGLAVADVFLQSGVVYEVAAAVFKPTGTWTRDTKSRLVLLAFAGICCAALLTRLATQKDASLLASLVSKGSFFIAVLMAELFVGMLVISVAAGLPWRGPAAKVGYGFGIYSLADVLLQGAHDIFGKAYVSQLDVVFSEVRSSVYVGCLVYWIVEFARAEVPSSERRDVPASAAMWLALLSRNGGRRK